MAFTLNGSTQYLSASAPANGSPMTIAAWCNPRIVQSGVPVSVGVGSGSHRNQLQVVNGGVGVLAVQLAAVGGLGTFTQPTTDTSASGKWLHGAAVFTSATSRTPYLNGAAGTTNTADVGTQNTFNATTIGARWSTTLGLYFDGDIAEVGVWNVALTAAEIASLAKGFTCDRVRPQSLVFYAPLIRDLVDVRGGLAITNNNTATVANHPRVYA